MRILEKALLFTTLLDKIIIKRCFFNFYEHLFG